MKESEYEALAEIRKRVEAEIRRTVVGLDEAVEEVLLALFAGGHVLLVGVPGLAKTLLVKTVARAFGLDFRRVQFTPDLMPSDITGTEVLDEEPGTGRRTPRFIPGPVFTHVLLADEINRTPPRTQAALLESMQERQVTVGSHSYPLPDPFFVLATQNPIEQEGTYPLPEAQLDRFFFQIRVPYPSFEEETRIAHLDPVLEPPAPAAVLDPERLRAARSLVRGVAIAETLTGYAVALARASRPKDPTCPEEIRGLIGWGAGPRASQYLVLAARVRAALEGRLHVRTDDIRRVAPGVLRHRILPNYLAEAEGLSSDDLLIRLLARVPVPSAE